MPERMTNDEAPADAGAQSVGTVSDAEIEEGIGMGGLTAKLALRVRELQAEESSETPEAESAEHGQTAGPTPGMRLMH